MAISRVALAGATGNLGPAILKALLDSNFQVTVLGRSTSNQVDARARVQVVDYSSQDSLVAALQGHDAFVNTLGASSVPLEVHLRLVEAAHTAGVRRFIPSEFGCNTTNPNTAQLPVFGDKMKVVEKLKEFSKDDSAFTYTSIITGPFLDWGIDKGFLINLHGPSLIYDGGDVPVSATTLAGIGRAVVGVFNHLEETKNRYVLVEQAQVTQNQLLEWSGKGDQIERVPAKTEDLEREAYEAVQQTPPDFGSFATKLIKRAVFGGKFGAAFTNVDNDVLGVPKLSESDIVGLLK